MRGVPTVIFSSLWLLLIQYIAASPELILNARLSATSDAFDNSNDGNLLDRNLTTIWKSSDDQENVTITIDPNYVSNNYNIFKNFPFYHLHLGW